MAVRIVGALGIKVRPDTTEFNKELRAELQKSNNENVKVEVDPNAKLFTKKVERLAAETSRELHERNVAVKVPVQVTNNDMVSAARRAAKDANEKIKSSNIRLNIPLGIDERDLGNQVREAFKHAEADLRSKGVLKLKVEIDLDTEKAKQELDHFVRSNNNKKLDLNANIDRQEKVRAQVAALTRNRYLDIVVRLTKRSMVTARASLASLFGVNVLSRAGNFLDHMAQNLDTYAATFARVGTTVATAASGILASVSSVAGIGGSLGQLGGFLLGLPAATGAIGAFVAVNVAAFKNFKSAIDGNANAMAQLPVNAQGAARALHGTWTEMQKPIQEAYWSKMGGVFEDLVSKTLPEVKAGLIEVGGQAGNFTQQIIRAFTEQGGTGLFAGMFHSMSEGLKGVNQGIRPFIGAIIELGSAGSEVLPKVGQYIGDAEQTFASWVTRSADSGKIYDWMTNASTQAHNLGQVLANTKGIFSGIFDAAKAGGAGDLGTFADYLGRIRDIVQGPAFQGGMTSLFAGAHGAIDAVQGSLKDVGVTLHDLAPTLGGVMRTSGQIVGNLISSVARALNQDGIKNGLNDLFTGVNVGMAAFEKALPNVAAGVGSLGTIAGTVGATFGPVLGNLFAGISDFLVKLQPAIQNLVPIFANFSNSTVLTLIAVLNALAIPLNAISTIFQNLPGLIQTVLLSMLLFSKLMNTTFRTGGLDKGTRAIVTGLNNIPGAATRAASSTRTAFSGRAFTPFVAGLRSIPGEMRNAFKGIATSSPALNPSQLLRLPTPAAIGAGLLPLRSSLQSGLNNAVGSVRLGPDALRRIDQILPAPKGGFGAAAVKGFQGAFNTIKTGAKGLLSFLGGPWGIGIIAAFAVFQKMQQNSQEVKAETDKATQSYKDLAKAAGGAGEVIGGQATQKAAQDYLDTIKNIQAVEKYDGGTDGTSLANRFGAGLADKLGSSQKSFEDIIKTAGFSDSDITAVMSGKGSDGAKAFLQQLDGYLNDSKGSGLSRVFNGSQEEQAKLQEGVKAILQGADQSSKVYNDLWTNVATRSDQITGAIEALRSATGDPVTIDNINNIATGLDHLNGQTGSAISGNLETYARTLADRMGGSAAQIETNFGTISSSLIAYDSVTGKIQGRDAVGEIVRTLSASGVPIAQIRKGLEGLGYSIDDANKKITFQFGPAADKMGKVVTVLGEQVPKLDAASNGYKEVANAISAASGVDAGKLLNAITLNGYDPTKLAVGLANQGVSMAGISDVLKDIGVTGAPAATALAAASKAASNLAASSTLTGMQTFQKVMDDVAASTDKAADKANTLYEAIQTLRGNPLDHWQVTAAGSKSITDAQEAFYDIKKTIGEKSGINFVDGTGAALTVQTGLIDAIAKVKLSAADIKGIFDGSSEAGRQLGEVFQNLGRNQMAVAKDAFDGVISKGGGIAEAMSAARSATKPFTAEVDSLITQLGLTHEQADEVRRIFGLFPESTVATVTASVGGATGPLATVLAGLANVEKGGSFTVKGLTADATAKLTSLGLQVQSFPDGTSTVTVTGDPNAAYGKLAQFIADANNSRGSVSLDVNITKTVTQVVNTVQGFLANLGLGSTHQANGSVLDFYANGGIRKGGQGVMPKVNYFGNGSERHVAQIAPAGAWRVWAEPETGGEAYIPLASSKRERSMEILAKVANRFGVELARREGSSVQQYANGGVSDGSSSSSVISDGNTFHMIINNPVAEKTSVTATRAALRAANLGGI